MIRDFVFKAMFSGLHSWRRDGKKVDLGIQANTSCKARSIPQQRVREHRETFVPSVYFGRDETAIFAIKIARSHSACVRGPIGWAIGIFSHLAFKSFRVKKKSVIERGKKSEGKCSRLVGLRRPRKETWNETSKLTTAEDGEAPLRVLAAE